MIDTKPAHFTRRVGAALIAAACSTQPPPAVPASDPEAQAPLASSEPTGSSDPAAASTAEPAALLTPSPGEPGDPAASDTRGKADIQRVVADNRHKVRACYDAALAANPGIKGDLVVSFVIGPDGTVKQAEVNWSESDLHVPELDTCAVDAIKTLQFPASSRGLESKVNFPFNFNPQPPTPKSATPKP